MVASDGWRASLKRRLRANRVLQFPARIQTLWHYRDAARAKPVEALRYALKGRELSTFTYALENTDELAELIAAALQVEPALVQRYFDELDADEALREQLVTRLRSYLHRSHIPRYTKRLAYYAIVRIRKPSLIVETGTHYGLGAVVIARALERNESEGDPPGTLLTFDTNPNAGWLVPDSLERFVHRVTGPTSDTLAPTLSGRTVDLFIHDSLRTVENELRELETVTAHAPSGELVLATDHAPPNYVLREFCRARGAWYGEFQERPIAHFYPGTRMGLGILGRPAAAGQPLSGSATAIAGSGPRERDQREDAMSEREGQTTTEEQSGGFGDDVAEGGGGEQGPPPETVEDDLTEGGTVDPTQ